MNILFLYGSSKLTTLYLFQRDRQTDKTKMEVKENGKAAPPPDPIFVDLKDATEDEDLGVTVIESLCMNCQENVSSLS